MRGTASKVAAMAALAAIATVAWAQSTGPGGPGGQPVLGVAADEVPAVPYDAGSYRLLVPGAATGGRHAVIELSEGPGYNTPWHRHDTMEERYYVVEGTLDVHTAQGTRKYPAGSHVLIPPGTIHAQGNSGPGPVKVVLTITPAGFEQFFIDRAELHRSVKRGDPAFMERMVALAGSHGRWLQPAQAPEPPQAEGPQVPSGAGAGDGQSSDRAAEQPARPGAIGGQRDAHGCLAPAGYRWCARTNRCERSWELARARGFENTGEAFQRYCELPATG